MNNPEMKAAMMNRAERMLKDLEVKEQDVLKFGPGNAMSKVKDQDLLEKIEGQVEELVAQVGRTSVSTIETRDMRGRENLHEKYQDKAVKLDQKAFDKKMGEALKYENKKNNRNMGESFLYNMYRKPLQFIDAIRPSGDKPIFKPWQKAMIGVIAIAALAPPANIIAAVLFIGKALDEKTGVLTKLAEKIFGNGEEREVINNSELEKVNVKDLVTEVSQDRVQDRVQDREQDRVQDRVQDRERPEIRSEVQSSIDKFDEIMRSRPEIQQNLDKAIETAKDIAGKDKSGKQRSVDTGDLELAQDRIKHHKQSSTGRY